MRAQVRSENRWRVRLRTDATGAIKLAIIQPPAPVLAGRWKPRPVDGSDARSAYLSNSDKLQKSDLGLLQRRPKKPSQRICPGGIRTVREACAVLKHTWGRNIAFATLTLPGSTRDALRTAAAHCRRLQNNFLRKLAYHLGLLDYVWIWELQVRGALHAHFAFGISRRENLNELNRLIRRLWRESLEDLSDKEEVDLFERAEGGTWRGNPRVLRARVEWVRKDVGAYMSKYLSKGSATGQIDEELLPKSWWSISRNVRHKMEVFRQTQQAHFQTEAAAQEAYKTLSDALIVHAAKVYDTKNPYTQNHCGKVYYYEDEQLVPDFDDIAAVLRVEERRLWSLGVSGAPDNIVVVGYRDDEPDKIYLWRE